MWIVATPDFGRIPGDMAACDPLADIRAWRQTRHMRTSLVLFATCILLSCRNAETGHAPQTKQERIVTQYEAWAARQPRPSPQLVDRIEMLLPRESCIGRLDQWSRHYGFNRLPEKTIDEGVVDFQLEEAGSPNVKAGRHITAPDSWVNLDDRPIKMAWGDYDVKGNRIRVAFCGNNFGGPGQKVDNMKKYFDELKRRRSAAFRQ